MSRAKLDIDAEQVEALASLCFQPREIADILQVPADKILKEYMTLIDNVYPDEKVFIKKRSNRIVRLMANKEEKNKFRYKTKKLLRYLGYQNKSEKEDMVYTSLRAGLVDSLNQQGVTIHALGRGAVEFILGYTIKELMFHMEQLFIDGMTWRNYGKWHIDHKKPKSWFKFNTAQDTQFLECWGLENLQPKWAKDNMSKGNKYDG